METSRQDTDKLVDFLEDGEVEAAAAMFSLLSPTDAEKLVRTLR